MAKRGRPTKYSLKIAEYICAEMAAGRSLRSVCDDEGMPDHTTVLGWDRADVDGFATQYARAREAQAETHAGQILEILDTEPNKVVTTRTDGTVEEKADPAHVAWLKNRADGRKWIASKLKPKTFGDKLDVEHSGAIDIGSRLDAARKRVPDAGAE